MKIVFAILLLLTAAHVASAKDARWLMAKRAPQAQSPAQVSKMKQVFAKSGRISSHSGRVDIMPKSSVWLDAGF